MASLPTEQSDTPLRPRMLDDMAMRSIRSRTQQDYVRRVRPFAAFLRRSPKTATAEHVRRFQLHQREHGGWESVIHATRTIRAVTGPLDQLMALMEGKTPAR